jgi:alpha-galactosidase
MNAALSRFALVAALAAAGCSETGSGSTGSGGGAGHSQIANSSSGGSSASSARSSSAGAGNGGGSSAAGSSETSIGGKTTTGGTTSTGGSSISRGGSTSTAGNSGNGGSGVEGGTTSSSKSTGTTGGAGGSVTTGGTVKGGTTGGTGGTGGATASGGTKSSGGTTSSTGTPGIVGATPPMGWNSWNAFGCDRLNESLVKGVADAFVTTGMKDVGYQYVCLDDCWMSGRDSSGALVADKNKFPNGIKALADYVHEKGLKLGIYESPGPTTCAGKTGSQGHEAQDAQTFASWGVDYLKYDLCSGKRSSFATMSDALKATGRPIFYSINPVYGGGSCVPPKCEVDELKLCNMWRIEFDINASWGSFTGLIDVDEPLAQYAGPGHWNDPDMLEVGNGSLSADENKAHFGMWAILAAPLITGNDVRSMNAATKAILTNADVVAVNQDPLGKQGKRVASSSSKEVWSKEMSGTNVRAVALFNRSSSASSMSVTWTQIGLPAGAATVRDLYAQKDLGSFTDTYTATSVPSHGIVMLKIVSGGN